MAKQRKPNSDRAWRGRSFRTWAPMTGTKGAKDTQIVRYRRVKDVIKTDRRESFK